MIRVFGARQVLISIVSALLIVGFLATSLGSYFVSRQSLRDAVVQTELPLTSDNIYSEIQKDLIQPILISSVMSADTFLRDWVLAGEREPEKIAHYLREIRTRYNAFASFFVSERTRNYYHADGILKRVHEAEPRDEWYFRVRKMTSPYEINVDPDLANQDAMTIFINFRVFDYEGRFIGATGIGLTVNAVRTLITDYQRRYGRTVYFVDGTGRIVLVGEGDSVPEHHISARGNLGALMPEWSKDQTRSLEYDYENRPRLLNVRFIPELDWFLLVEKDAEGDYTGIRQALYWNLLVCTLITALVLLATWLAINRYQKRLETMATTDQLTGLASRHAYEVLMDQALRDSRRSGQPLALVILDIDNFKSVNDRFGHVAGDRVLCGVGNAMRACLRSSDIICRWGGDEFIVALRNCDLHNAERLAETMRQTIAGAAFPYEGTPITVTVSLGVAVLQGEESAQDLVIRADAAMYRAKQEGRNRVRTDVRPEAA
ncbi:MAG TPA: sensor domain-containing diguanylate cyclase [Ferrovibrio sp.]|jgi:diguanylate cyclase (GGDEF)-like protein|uniref:sensor domain-containing diguanylate cyclase n=1 Tax=Ferrovibrio sp. TaxID=1917215 RepID=UPI002B4B9328|nr:sensor domain-containing diguanylate cyclase [Ferrovibrio sp.]HLT77372.1 sensor domain-containing diguanylate cyclase [Ferrovibrio sp.]